MARRRTKDPLSPFRLEPGSPVYQLLHNVHVLYEQLRRVQPTQILGLSLITLALIAVGGFFFGMAPGLLGL